jgi:hypothetical protein
MKRIKELNSKSKEILMTSFAEEYQRNFITLEHSKPLPVADFEFNDYLDFNFKAYKDVHIHSMDIYHNGATISGFEINYIMDGFYT